QVAFRTQGEFGLAVSGADVGKPYRMTVWIGDEVKRPMARVVVPKSEWRPGATPAAAPTEGAPERRATPATQADATDRTPGGGGGGSLAIWAIAGLLAVIAGLLFALLRKKREH